MSVAARSGIIAVVRTSFSWLAVVLLLAGACDASPPPDGGTDAALVDAALPSPDAAVVTDSAVADAAAEADGGGGPDAAAPAPVGTIDGTCGVLDTELTDPAPFFFENAMTFTGEWSSAEAERLSAGAQEILMDGTAGGSSGYSEAFAFEVLHRCEGATLIKSETEIVYDAPGSITDILVELDGHRIGVSVTRAVTVTGMCMRADTYTEAVAEDLLVRKLEGIQESSMNVSADDRWVKQVLFLFADTAAHAATLRTVWERLDPAVRADTILYVSVSEGTDTFIYFEDRC